MAKDVVTLCSVAAQQASVVLKFAVGNVVVLLDVVAAPVAALRRRLHSQLRHTKRIA